VSDLQAIRERHERWPIKHGDAIDAFTFMPEATAAHSDRATLLAEVDRLTTRLFMVDGATIDNGRVMWDALDTLRAENARLKALCGRAVDAWHNYRIQDDPDLRAIEAELREASDA